MLLWREYSVGFKVLKRYTKKGTKPLNWNKLKKKRRRKKGVESNAGAIQVVYP